MFPTSDSTPASTAPSGARLTADDWAQAALEIIARDGVKALAIEPLARTLGVTKGSFYWHFPSRDALLRAALERWEHFEQTIAFLPLRESVPDPRERLRRLAHIVAEEHTTHAVFAALINAADHPSVQPVIKRVSQRRVDYLSHAFLQAGMPADAAMYRAWLLYTAYIGFLQWNLQLQHVEMTREQLAAYVEHVIATLIPD